MPINTEHTDYQSRKKQWERCRDASEGSDAIKDKGTRYLPKLLGQTFEEYDAYTMRALWYGATGRTIQGLLGAVFRKDLSVAVPDQLESLLDDITLDGQSAQDFARAVEERVLTSGRVGILVDSQKGEASRAYAALYSGDNIVNWREARIGGKMVLVWAARMEAACEFEQVRDHRGNSAGTQWQGAGLHPVRDS